MPSSLLQIRWWRIGLSIVLITALCHSVITSQTNKPFIEFRDVFENTEFQNGWARCMIQDSKGFMWFGTDYGFALYDGYELTDYSLIEGDAIVSALLEDQSGDIWAFAGNKGLYHLERQTNQLTRIEVVDDPDYADKNITLFVRYSQSMLQDKEGLIWISTFEGIKKLDPLTFDLSIVKTAHTAYTGKIFMEDNGLIWELARNGIEVLNSPDSLFLPLVKSTGESIKLPERVYIYQAGDDNILIYHRQNGLFQLSIDLASNLAQLSPLCDFQPDVHINCYDLALNQKNELWIASGDNGLLMYDLSSCSLYQYKHDFKNEFGLQLKPVFTFIDKSDGLWISGYHSGITYASQSKKQFRTISSYVDVEYTLSSPYVVSFFERKNGDIWIATAGGGVNLWKRKENKFEHLQHDPENPNSLINNTCMMAIEDRSGYLWILSQGFHNKCDIQRYHISTGQFDVIQLPDKALYPRRMFSDPSGNIWISLTTGAYRYDFNTSQFQLVVPDQQMNYDNRSKTYWIKDSNKDRFCQYMRDGSINHCLDLRVVDVSSDSKGNMWFLTGNQGDTLYGYNMRLGQIFDTMVLPNARDHEHNKLIVDRNDGIWLATSDGIFLYQPGKKELKQFTHSDGISSNYLRFARPIQISTGELLFGSNKGFTIFHPDSIIENDFRPPVYVTDLRIGGKSVPVRGSSPDSINMTSPLMSHIHFAEEITLSHDQNDIAFEFAALDYTNPKRNQYKYKLEGYDNDFTITQASLRLATYTNLSPGKYTFHVQGSNNDGVWNETGDQLAITIFPPWYWAWWTKVIYILLILSVLYMLYNFQLNQKLARSEALRIKEIDRVKSKLYTNITHEFRTPLAVISGMADQVQQNPKEWFTEGIQLIKKNSKQLLTLINQLLDLSKLESGKLPVNKIQGNIVDYLIYLVRSFKSFADSKSIRLHFLPENKVLLMDYDQDKMQVIASNLISNAIKFTSEEGDIYIKIRETPEAVTEIIVMDTGIGIKQDKLPYIFDRFYQVDDSSTRKSEGTGIGLALTRELVQLLGGKIDVESELNKGTKFTVSLPITRQAPRRPEFAVIPPFEINKQSEKPVQDSLLASDQEKPIILVAEDNLDVQVYLQSCLQDNYQLIFADNGLVGIDKAIEHVPDIIISDVMMPEKDGLELVQTLKTDQRTSHIPIILLTAKADLDSKIEGLESGADAYLSKPFNKKELNVRLRKLIELRERLQSHYGSLDINKSEIPDGSEMESKFLQKITSFVLDNISDENYGIHQLCFDLKISRTQLHRKLKALTGLSTSRVIRSIRLREAKKLLLESDLSVSEVGYAVGFSNRSHFTQMFSKEFGKPPSTYKHIS